MSIVWLAALTAAVPIGMLLCWLGWRGRRINDHPHCRQCGFDLVSVLPAGSTCPESGAGIRLEKYVRRGARRRVWSVVLVGVVLVLLPGSLVGTLLFTSAAGIDLNRHKPVWLLAWEAERLAGDAQAGAIGRELLRRQQAGTLSADEEQRAAEAALAVQADTSRAWDEAWGDLFESARAAGLTGPDQAQRYLDQSVIIAVRCRPRARVGGVLPVEVSIAEARIGSGTTLTAFAHQELRVTLENSRLGLRVTLGNTRLQTVNPAGVELPLNLVASGSAVQRFAFMNRSVVLLRVPEDAEPGTRELEAGLRLLVDEPNRAVVAAFTPATDRTSGVEITERLSVELVDGPTAEVAEPTEDERRALDASFASAVAMAQVHQVDGALLIPRNMTVSIVMPDPRVPFAYEVSARVGGQRTKLGVFTSQPAGGGSGYDFAQPGQVMATFAIGTPAELADTLTLELSPSVDAAERTVGLTRAVGVARTIENVPVQVFTTDERGRPVEIGADEANERRNPSAEDRDPGSLLRWIFGGGGSREDENGRDDE